MTAQSQVTEKSSAFYEGYGAFGAGEPLSNCPRVTDVVVSQDWRLGWITARDAHRDANPPGRRGTT